VHWDTAWTAIKDILLTGTGMVLILSQVFSHTPSDVLLVTGLALTVPSVAAHAGHLLAGHPGGGSSPPSPPSGSSPSGSLPPEANGDAVT
jgi:hypothetical protein